MTLLFLASSLSLPCSILLSVSFLLVISILYQLCTSSPRSYLRLIGFVLGGVSDVRDFTNGKFGVNSVLFLILT